MAKKNSAPKHTEQEARDLIQYALREGENFIARRSTWCNVAAALHAAALVAKQFCAASPDAADDEK